MLHQFKPQCKGSSTPPFKRVLMGPSPMRFANFKRECKEPSTHPLKVVLVGSSPIAFANYALVAQLAEVARLERVQCRFESDRGYQSKYVEEWL